MRFSICVIEPESYRYAHFLYDICKYLCYGIESAGYECCILRNRLSSDRVNVIVGAHNQTDPGIIEKIRQAGNYILIQSEIITGDSINNWSVQKSFADVYLPLMRQAKAVWTGVETNVSALKKLDVEADLIRVGYHPQMEEVHHKRNKDIDFLFCGSITPHRKKLLEGLIAHGGKVVTIFDDAAMYRNDLIARAKINLAPNQGPEMNHFGGSRVLYLINNRSMVVVERCHDQTLYEHCFPFADTEQWVNLCMETLHRPDLTSITEEYYERFKKIRMVDLITPLLDKFLNATKHFKHSAAPMMPETSTDTSVKTCNADSQHQQFAHQDFIEGMTSIIMVTNNQLEPMKKCIESIRKYTPQRHEIIFVECGATDGAMKWVKRLVLENRNYRLIESGGKNVPSKYLNQGMKAAIGEYIMLLHSDLVVTEGWLSGMLECLNSGMDIGIVGPLTNSIGGPRRVVELAYSSIDGLEKYAKSFREKYRHCRIPMKSIVGACMLFKHELLDKIGSLDETFGIGNFEDDDFCLRAVLDGYHNVIAGDVFLHHHGSRSFVGDTINCFASITSNRKLFDEKWSRIDIRSTLGEKLLAVKALDKADQFYQRGETEQAIQVLLEGMAYAKSDKRLYFTLTEILLDSKRFRDAFDVITQIPEDAGDLRTLTLAGFCKDGLELPQEAEQYAERALAIDHNYAPALNLKGLVAYKKGEKSEAAAFFGKAAESDPGYGEPYTNLGVILWSEGNHSEGLDLLERGFILSPTLGDMVDAYYSAITQSAAFERAEAVLRLKMALYPTNKRIVFLLIDCLIRQRKDLAAISEIEEAMTTFGIDDGILSAALAVREKVGPKEIDKSKKEPTISLCMIVKNEEDYLPKCLLGVHDLVDEMIVVDTGSMDRTRDIANAYGAKVYDFEWNHDFSEARNASLSKASGDWILILDADEVISRKDFEKLRRLVRKKKGECAYVFTTRNYVDRSNVEGWMKNDGAYDEEAGLGWLPSCKVRLFQNDQRIRFENPVHELVEPSLKKINKKMLDSIIPIHHYGKLNNEKSLTKGERYYLLGKKKLQERGDDRLSLLELALQAAELKKYDEAIDLWYRLLKIEPNFAKAYFNLGYVYLKLGKFEEGIKSSRRALEIDPSLKESTLNLASCELYGGSVDSAITALEEMLAKHPEHPAANALLGVAYFAAGKNENGVACMETVKKMHANCPGIIQHHAAELEKAGRYDLEVRLLETAVSTGYVNNDIILVLEELKKQPAKTEA